MFRLIVATLAGLYVLMLTAGEPVVAEENAVAQSSFDSLDFSLASFTLMPEQRSAPDGMVSDEEAVTLAMAAAKAMRENRENPETLKPLLAAVETAPTEAEIEQTRELWSVTGTLVNLRAGPSTRNEVVAQVSQGTAAAVLEERDGWYQIETSDGATSGWIFGKYLTPDA